MRTCQPACDVMMVLTQLHHQMATVPNKLVSTWAQASLFKTRACKTCNYYILINNITHLYV